MGGCGHSKMVEMEDERRSFDLMGQGAGARSLLQVPSGGHGSLLVMLAQVLFLAMGVRQERSNYRNGHTTVLYCDVWIEYFSQPQEYAPPPPVVGPRPVRSYGHKLGRLTTVLVCMFHGSVKLYRG